MVPESQEERSLVAANAQFSQSKASLTAADIAIAYKAALSDFVRGKTTRQNTSEVSSLLSGALAARKQQLLEEKDLSSMHVKNYF